MNKISLKHKILGIILTLLPSLAFADSIPSAPYGIDTFTPKVTDYSLIFLERIFGHVGTSLAGQPQTLLGHLFGIFNTGVLAIAAIFLIYTTFRVVVETAHSGEVLKGKISYWIIVRVAAGVAALVPSVSGYSILQIVMMFFVTQGIGFVDKAWDMSLNYLRQGGVIYSVPNPASQDNSSADQIDHNLIDTTGTLDPSHSGSTDILRSLVCMNQLEKMVKSDAINKKQDVLNNPQNYTASQIQAINATDENVNLSVYYDESGKIAYVPGDNSSKIPKGACGAFTWGVTGKINPDKVSAYEASKETGLKQIIAELTPTAKELSTKVADGNDQLDTYKKVVMQQLVSTAYSYQSSVYLARMSPDKNPLSDALFNQMTNSGWAMAGSFYFTIANLNKAGLTDDTSYQLSVLNEDSYPPSIGNEPKRTNGLNRVVAIMGNNQTLIENMKKSLMAVEDSRYGAFVIADYLNRQIAEKNAGAAQIVTDLKKSSFFGDENRKNLDFSYQMPNRWVLDVEHRYCSVYWGYSCVEFDTDKLTILVTEFKEHIDHPLPNETWTCIKAPYQSSESDVDLYFGKLKEDLGVPRSLPVLDTLLSVINDNLNVVIKHWFEDLSDAGTGAVPIAEISTFGRQMVESAIHIYGDLLLKVRDYEMPFFIAQKNMIDHLQGVLIAPYEYSHGLLQSGSLMAANQYIFSLIFMVVPLAISIATPMLVSGAMLMVYIPLVPFMLFTFGVVSWFISVVEAMTAAPLVALGLTHPEGHDMMGKSEQAIMLLLSVFVRPICMLIGLISGIIMLYIGYGLLNAGFGNITSALFEGVSQGNSVPIVPALGFLLILIQTYILVALVNQCFGMIYVIPDKVMGWIGHHQQSSDIPHLVESVKAGVQPFVDSAAHGMGQAVSASKGATDAITHGMGNVFSAKTQYYQAREQFWIDMIKSVSQMLMSAV